MELSEIRKKIDALDSDIRELILKRLDIARDVVMAKMESGDVSIYRGDRENTIIDRLTEGLDESTARLLGEIYSKMMISSRSIQYRILTQEMPSIYDSFAVGDAMNIDTLICQGIEGAYSHIAAMKLKPKRVLFKDSFGAVIDEIGDDSCGVLPLDNSTEGMVNEVYDLLLRRGLYIVKSIDLPIVHSVLINKGAHDVKYITAHPQALAQCSEYIESHGLTAIPATNNAVAAREVRDSNRLDIACICDKSNAVRYGLEVQDEGIANTPVNTTRFIVVGDRLIAPQHGGKVSIVFSVSNKSGTLASVLNIIASYGVSMSKIESRPIADEKWEFRFYADLIGNIRDNDMIALLYQLKSELPYIKILGSYDELNEGIL